MAASTRESDVEAAVVAKLRALPPERRREVLAFVESLAQRDGKVTDVTPSNEDDALIRR